MMIDTRIGGTVGSEFMAGYFRNLVNMFFKILPMKENGEESLSVYMQSMQSELLGCQHLITILNDDALFMSLLFILQSLIDNPDWSPRRVKREVFRAISICNKMRSKFGGDGIE